MDTNDNSLFVGFDFFEKQYEDPDNPDSDELGLTSGSTRTPSTTNISHNEPDPAAQMGQLNVRQGRIGEMQARMAEGKEAFPGEAERHRDLYGIPDPEDDVSDEQLVAQYQRLFRISPEEAAAQAKIYRQQHRDYVPPEEMTESEAEANLQREAGIGSYYGEAENAAENWERAAHRDEIASTEAWNRARSGAESYSDDDDDGAFGKSHDEMISFLNQSIDFMEKQQLPKGSVPEASVEELEQSWGDPDDDSEYGLELNESQQNWLASQDKDDADLDDINSQSVPRKVLDKLPGTNRNEFNDPDTEEYGLGLNESQQNWLSETEKRDEELDTPRSLPQSEVYDPDTDSYASGDGFIKALGSVIETMEKQVTATPEGWDEDDYNEWLTYDAPKTPEGRKVLGMKNHEAGGDKCVGEDCVIHGTPLYEREDPY